MKSVALILATCIITSTSTSLAWAQSEHSTITSQEIKWGPAPPSVPPGAQAAVLYGDPGKEGMFAFRLKMPKDYHIAPHTHPKPESVTVTSGTAPCGMGHTAAA